MNWFNSTSLGDAEGKIDKCSNDDYHRLPHISSSDLKWMLKTPAHYKRNVLEKSTLERPNNEAFTLGSSLHEAFLEQRTDLFVAAPDVDRRTKAGRETWESFCRDNSDRRVISADQHKRLIKMFDVLSSNEKASYAVSRANVLIEESYIYRDKDTGLLCKFRPDIMFVGEEGIEIDDFKTAQAASPHEFAKACGRYQYALSAAHYVEGAERLFGKKVLKYRFIVQEVDDPYAVAFYRLSESDLNRAKDLRSLLMKKINGCFTSNAWPDWSSEELVLSIPGYAFNLKEQE